VVIADDGHNEQLQAFLMAVVEGAKVDKEYKFKKENSKYCKMRQLAVGNPIVTYIRSWTAMPLSCVVFCLLVLIGITYRWYSKGKPIPIKEENSIIPTSETTQQVMKVEEADEVLTPLTIEEKNELKEGIPWHKFKYNKLRHLRFEETAKLALLVAQDGQTRAFESRKQKREAEKGQNRPSRTRNQNRYWKNMYSKGLEEMKNRDTIQLVDERGVVYDKITATRKELADILYNSVVEYDHISYLLHGALFTAYEAENGVYYNPDTGRFDREGNESDEEAEFEEEKEDLDLISDKQDYQPTITFKNPTSFPKPTKVSSNGRPYQAATRESEVARLKKPCLRCLNKQHCAGARNGNYLHVGEVEHKVLVDTAKEYACSIRDCNRGQSCFFRHKTKYVAKPESRILGNDPLEFDPTGSVWSITDGNFQAFCFKYRDYIVSIDHYQYEMDLKNCKIELGDNNYQPLEHIRSFTVADHNLLLFKVPVTMKHVLNIKGGKEVIRAQVYMKPRGKFIASGSVKASGRHGMTTKEGDCGSPIFDCKGHVIGIHCAGSEGNVGDNNEYLPLALWTALFDSSSGQPKGQ